MSAKPWIKVGTDYDGLRKGLAAIADRRVFCVYRTLQHKTNPDKAIKIPQVPDGRGGVRDLTGRYDATLVPKLLRLEDAIALAQANGCDGVGIVFTTGCGVLGVDLDHAVADGKLVLTPDQRRILEAVKAHSFVERSMSGTGLHAIMIADGPTIKAVHAGVEVFGDSNFVALTGKGRGQASEAPQPVTDDVMATVRRLRGERVASATPPGPAAADAATLNADVLAANYPPPTPDVVREALALIPAATADGCGYDLWRNLVWAVKDALGDDGEGVARQWSMTAPGDYDADAFDTVWRSDRGTGITVGTLFHAAMQRGWVPPWRQPTTLPTVIRTDRGEPVTLAETLPVAQTLNDAGNARRLYNAAAGKIRFDIAENCWVSWQGGRWRHDQHGHMLYEASPDISRM